MHSKERFPPSATSSIVSAAAASVKWDVTFRRSAGHFAERSGREPCDPTVFPHSPAHVGADEDGRIEAGGAQRPPAAPPSWERSVPLGPTATRVGPAVPGTTATAER